jgi:hypothetical protein
MPSKQVTIQGVMTWEGDMPSQGPGFPTHPIAPGGSTPPWGIPIYPGVGWPVFPTNPIAPGGTTPPWGIPVPPYPSTGPGFPTHPIAPGGQPPSIWPSPGRPDQGLPQPPTIWPGPGYPDQGLPGQPPSIWPGPGKPDQGLPGAPPNVNVPTFPSQLPMPGGGGGGMPPVYPVGPVPVGDGSFVGYWSPTHGWVLVPAPVPPDGGGETPAPPTVEPHKASTTGAVKS